MPLPSDVVLSAVVGFCDVLQHTPLEVTVVPPAEITFPPDVAPLDVMFVNVVVVTVGGSVPAVKLTSLP